MYKVGFQGNNGTFSEIAALKYFEGTEIEEIGYPNFVKIMEDIAAHRLDYAVLPVENTTTGIISRTYDLFRFYPVHAVGEVLVPIVDDLIGLPGTDPECIAEVYSHPEALSQCAKFFATHPQVKQVPWQDTAKSVEYVKECNDPTKAALGSYRAAEFYGMESLVKCVQDSSSNVTRFLVVTWREEIPTDADKTSLMLVVKHEPGSLYRALAVLATMEINMTKLESRPMQDRMFEYLFYLDIQGTVSDPVVKYALSLMEKHCNELVVFGSYKAAPVDF